MPRLRLPRSMLVAGGVCAMVLVGATSLQAQQYDQPYDDSSSGYADDVAQAPGRVARLAYLSGQVQFAPAGENAWGSVEINRPMVIGDRVLTGDDGRAALELGDASVRIDHGSAFDFLNLDQGNVQIELSQGTLNLAVRQLDDGENFEVDTPTLAFVASAPGVYRIDNDPDGSGSMVTVFRGAGTVYGENGASRRVVAGTAYRFDDSTLASVDEEGLPQPDDFDRFCETRDDNYARYAQREQQYVPPEMIGGDDLYQYGEWNAVPQYGNVWYPTSVPTGWAPYRYGHWAWIDPWGWTWVDNQPWGFAPFHYGRWVHVSNRWGWCPGPVSMRPVYAPALVAFIGGSGLSVSVRIGGGPVGWFPLGPRDVYVPWFHASRHYFNRVNVTNIRNVYVNQTVINNVYNDYSHGRFNARHHRYAYRHTLGAVTVVPRKVFTDARPVHSAVLKLDRNRLARTEVALRPNVNPGTASLGLRHPSRRPAIRPDREPFARPVVARRQPPPRPVEFDARKRVIANQHGQPLTPAQMRDLRTRRPATEPRDERVKLVGDAAAPGAMRRRTTPPRPTERPERVASTHPSMAQRPNEPAARRISPAEPFKNTVHPIPARLNPVNPARDAAPRPNEMPSARFAHAGEPRTLPRPAVIRPAHEPRPRTVQPGRLPVARPIEPAPRSRVERVEPRQRQADLVEQQHIREQQTRDQQVQRQRQLQEQTQQRARQQHMAQQAQSRMQEQQRSREQQLQRRAQEQAQQRQAQVDAQRRNRQQEARQQRQTQMLVEQRQRTQQMQQMRMQQAQRSATQHEIQRSPQRRTPRNTPEPRETPVRRHPPSSSNNPIR